MQTCASSHDADISLLTYPVCSEFLSQGKIILRAARLAAIQSSKHSSYRIKEI